MEGLAAATPLAELPGRFIIVWEGRFQKLCHYSTGPAWPSEGAACLLPSYPLPLALFPSCTSVLLCSLVLSFSWCWCGAVSPLFEGETITSHQSPSSPQGARYCYGDPLVAFAHSDLFTFFFPLLVTMGSTLPQWILCSCRYPVKCVCWRAKSTIMIARTS